MRIMVAIKRVVDFNIKIRVNADGSGVDLANVKMSINPFDLIALEEAVRLKEKGIASEIVVVSIGEEINQEILREALAFGADRALLIKNSEALEPLNIVKLLKEVVKKESPQLVILGKQAIDDDCNQTGQMLAALLNWPQATFASKIIIQNDHALVTREVDNGLETIETTLPVVITTDLRLNEPRYVTLPNIMKAKQKKIEIIESGELVTNLKPHLQIKKIEAPSVRKPGVKVNSIEELLDKLKNEFKVLT